MARMIPDVSPRMIENDGERLFYSACRDLPSEYTVLYSYKYRMGNIHSGSSESSEITSISEKSAINPPENPEAFHAIGEADFVIVHPELGYVVFEVKQGNIMYANGQWHEFRPSGKGSFHRTRPMAKDPVDQAQRAMWAILERYKEKLGAGRFPLNIRFALCFPETKILAGELPDFIDPNSIFLYDDLDNLNAKIRSLFPKGTKPDRTATQILIDKVLSPSFKVFALLEQQIQIFHSAAERILTDEQSRILEETELDKKKVFFGAAGTGKTYLAMEKARQLADSGKRVLLTCFNKNLASGLRREIPAEITCSNFHDFLMEVLTEKGFNISVPEDSDEQQEFFNNTLPEMGFDYYMEAPDADKFDSIIVDEGQDFHENWLLCLESMLRSRKDGEFYIFADPNQDLFGVSTGHLMKLPVSKHRLTRNLRNAETISDWLAPFIPQGHLKPVLRGGIPVAYHPWETAQEEKRMIEREIGRLVSQGIRPGRILILSPNRLENSCLAGCDKIGSWPLVDFRRLRNHKFKLPESRVPNTRRTPQSQVFGNTGSFPGGPTENIRTESSTEGHKGSRRLDGDVRSRLEGRFTRSLTQSSIGSNTIGFATIRSFKGLESDIVFLIGLRAGKRTCTDADIYVGASRARFMLQVFHDKDMPPKKLALCLGRT